MATLDTSFLVDIDRGHDGAIAALEHLFNSETPMRVPAPAAAEYVAGYEDPVANLHDLELSYTLVGYDREHVLETARIARNAFAQGTFPGWTDAQVAATAVLYDEPVVTANPHHFEAFGCAVWDHRNEARPPG